MSNQNLPVKVAQLTQFLQYIHDHTGKDHPPSMLHTNNMIDRLRVGHLPASVVASYLERLVIAALAATLPKPP